MRLLAILIAAWALVPGALLASQTVYKSVGADGRVHYGDEPMADAVAVETIELKEYDTEEAPSTEAMIEQMAATTDRLQEDRREREERRAEKAQERPREVIYYPAQPRVEERTYVAPWFARPPFPFKGRHSRHDRFDGDHRFGPHNGRHEEKGVFQKHRALGEKAHKSKTDDDRATFRIPLRQ